MALENRIDSLKKQHAQLDKLLHTEETRPSGDVALVHKLKTQKLALKDQIESLLQGTSVAA